MSSIEVCGQQCKVLLLDPFLLVAQWTWHGDSVITITITEESTGKQIVSNSFSSGIVGAMTYGPLCPEMKYFVTFRSDTRGNFQQSLPVTMPSLGSFPFTIMPMKVRDLILHSFKENQVTLCWENWMAANNWTASGLTFTVTLEDVEAKTTVQIGQYTRNTPVTHHVVTGLIAGKEYKVHMNGIILHFQTPVFLRKQVHLCRPDGFGEDEFRQRQLEELKALPRLTNLMTLGASGHGKSSLITTLLQAFSRKREAVVSGDPTHGTTEFRRFNLAGNLNLWDCVGLSKNNFEGIVFDRMLSGRYSSGKSLGSGISNSDPHLSMFEDPRNVIHNVIFVVSASDLKGNKSLQEQLSEYRSLLVKRGYNPVMVLTKVDQVAPEIEFQLAKVFDSEKVAEALKTAAELTGISLSRIFPVKNLTNEYGTNTLAHQVPLMAIAKAAAGARFAESNDPPQTGMKDQDQMTSPVGEDSFDEFLLKNSLAEFKSTFKSLGVDCVEDFIELEDDDLIDAAIPKPKLRRIIKLIKSTRDKLTP
eukprot:TRINITY_DN4972_c0_g1_i1.p1 TRINITY_DN4972_c0_g1~~TRINITY_DN4972_c0_g1_i1.p1  ORF type:complete len:549 (-),score=141.45 TRINITY_DN4972_c0_g1_i1:53-1645(-)